MQHFLPSKSSRLPNQTDSGSPCLCERKKFILVIETIKTSSLNTKLKVAYIFIVVYIRYL